MQALPIYLVKLQVELDYNQLSSEFCFLCDVRSESIKLYLPFSAFTSFLFACRDSVDVLNHLGTGPAG